MCKLQCTTESRRWMINLASFASSWYRRALLRVTGEPHWNANTGITEMISVKSVQTEFQSNLLKADEFYTSRMLVKALGFHSTPKPLNIWLKHSKYKHATRSFRLEVFDSKTLMHLRRTAEIIFLASGQRLESSALDPWMPPIRVSSRDHCSPELIAFPG